VTLDKTQISKFVYVGQGGALSIIPLKILCDQGLRPEAVIIADTSHLPKGMNLLPLRPPRVVDSLAAEADKLNLPFFYWQRGSEDEIEAKLGDITPDVVMMSCFPWRVAESLLSVPVHGWLNLHPSLLPAYRGPTPLFWQARAGETQTGVSLHCVLPELDTGDILAQQAVSLLDTSGKELERELARQGATLMQRALLAKDSLVPTPQRQQDASYQGFPSQQDFCIETTGVARNAYQFIRLMGEAYPLWLEINTKQFRVKQALSYDDQGKMHEAFYLDDNLLNIQFEQGVLVVLVEEF